MSTPATYQRHIDGLRAVAVLSVIFYHFGQDAFSGGFVGVDVFFVISGYLITSLILKELSARGDFNFRRFYIRRMRRLLPAMAVTFSASLVAAVLLFSPERLQAFGRSLAAAVLSFSNVVFWTESGYFDADSHLKPLLHTWSLGVEEQFYFIWPALLWLAARGASGGRLSRVLVAVGLASFGLNALWAHGGFDAEYASTLFYLTPFRIFELVIGAAAIFIAPRLPASRALHEGAMLLGLALIAFAVFTYDDTLVFPYYAALAPCLGALLVILGARARTVGWLLTNRLAVSVGLVSYSAYLVHWPLLVFYSYYRFEPLGQYEYAVLFIATMLLAVALYFFVEKPLRRNAPAAVNPAPQRGFVLCGITAMLALALAGLYGWSSGGATRFNAGSLPVATVLDGKQERFRLIRRGCNLTRLADPRYCDAARRHQILVIGNSHEPDGYNAFARVYAGDPQVNLISFGTLNKCQVRMSLGGPVSPVSLRDCDKRTALLNDRAFVAGLDGIILSSNKPFAPPSDITWQILAHLRSLSPGLPIVVLGGYFNLRYDCAELYNRFGSFESCRDPRHITYDPLQGQEEHRARLAVAGPDYLYIDKTALLCTGGSPRSCAIQAGSEPAFYDAHHLTLPFATLLGEKIANTYARALAEAGFPAPADGNATR